MKELDDITGNIVDAALGIHRGLGPSASPRLRVNHLNRLPHV